MIRPYLFAAAFLAGSFATPAFAVTGKFAFVDLQRALEETDDGKKAKAKLKSDFDRKQQELDAKQEELKKMKEAFDKKAQLMKPEALQKEQKELQDRFVELQTIYQRLQKDLAEKEQAATRGIFTKLQAVVGKIADRDKFDMVLEKNAAVVWGQPSLDITNEVIRMYNADSGSSSPSKK
jgi:outer membrane protein